MKKGSGWLLIGCAALALAGILGLSGCASYPDAQRVRELRDEKAKLFQMLRECEAAAKADAPKAEIYEIPRGKESCVRQATTFAEIDACLERR